MTKVEKPKEERVKEGIALLKQVLDLGVPDQNSAYIELKQQITAWINTGKAWDGKIPLYPSQRQMEVSLPRSAHISATINIRK
jgi:hypothetical protein